MYSHAPEGYICPFCLVGQGMENEHILTRQADIFYKDKTVMAFISAHCWPNNKGHVLIIPRQHYENIYELPDAVSARIHSLEREVALALKAVYCCDGVSSRQHNEPAGNQDVWHYHLHVFPRYAGDGLYGAAPVPLSAPQRAEYAARLRQYFAER